MGSHKPDTQELEHTTHANAQSLPLTQTTMRHRTLLFLAFLLALGAMMAHAQDKTTDKKPDTPKPIPGPGSTLSQAARPPLR